MLSLDYLYMVSYQYIDGNYFSISNCLALIDTQNIFSYVASLGLSLRKIANAPNDPTITFNVTRSKAHHICITSTHESQISPHFALRSLIFHIIEVLVSAWGTMVNLKFSKPNREKS